MSHRIITTEEELEALDAGSVILCEGDRTGEGVDTQALTLATAEPPATGYHWRNHWLTYFGNGVIEDFEKVTVIWEPES